MVPFRKPMNCIQDFGSRHWFPQAPLPLVLLARPGINSLAAFLLASRPNLPGNSRARANRGCDVWGRENEKTAVCVLCLDTRAGFGLTGVGTIADQRGNRPG